MKMFDAGKTRMIGLPYGEKKTMTIMLSRFHTIPACYGRTDGQADGHTIAILSISRVSTIITYLSVKTETRNPMTLYYKAG